MVVGMREKVESLERESGGDGGGGGEQRLWWLESEIITRNGDKILKNKFITLIYLEIYIFGV